jgi:hypothetical protein
LNMMSTPRRIRAGTEVPKRRMTRSIPTEIASEAATDATIIAIETAPGRRDAARPVIGRPPSTAAVRPVRARPSSARGPHGRAQPHADRCRSEASADDRPKLATEAVDVEFVPKVRGEALHRLLGIVTGAIEAPVHR